MVKKTYRYDGAVLEFDRLVAERWRASTCAVTPEKAKSNLAYRFKMENGRMPNSKITLPGKLEEVSIA